MGGLRPRRRLGTAGTGGLPAVRALAWWRGNVVAWRGYVVARRGVVLRAVVDERAFGGVHCVQGITTAERTLGPSKHGQLLPLDPRRVAPGGGLPGRRQAPQQIPGRQDAGAVWSAARPASKEHRSLWPLWEGEKRFRRRKLFSAGSCGVRWGARLMSERDTGGWQKH